MAEVQIRTSTLAVTPQRQLLEGLLSNPEIPGPAFFLSDPYKP